MVLKLLFSAWFWGKSELFVPILRYEKTLELVLRPLANQVSQTITLVPLLGSIFQLCLTALFRPLVNPEIKEKLQALASAEGQTVSAYLTDMIKRKKMKKSTLAE